MNNLIGILLLAGGVVLLVCGFQEKRSFSNEVSGIFSASPHQRVTLLIAGGVGGVVGGAALIFASGKFK